MIGTLEDYLHKSIQAQRQQTLSESDQLTLGEMILKMEAIVEKETARLTAKPSEYGEVQVYYDFGSLYPKELMSWRGIYRELAMNYTGLRGEPNTALKASEFLALLKGAIGTEYTGYKGGEFRMDKHTPVW